MQRAIAAIYDWFMHDVEEKSLSAWRADLLAKAAGDVLEIGAGTAVNLPYYPPEVTRLVLSEPDRFMRRRLDKKLGGRRGSSDPEPELLDAPAERLPVPDASFDTVVGTLVMCSVSDPQAVLAELRRVLRPGGRYIFLEHVASHEPGLFKWQRRIEPFWKPVAGNCHLTRHTEDAIVDAGFALEVIERDLMRGAWPILRPTIRGVARKT